MHMHRGGISVSSKSICKVACIYDVSHIASKLKYHIRKKKNMYSTLNIPI